MEINKCYIRNPENYYHYNYDNIKVFTDKDTIDLNPLYVAIIEKCDGLNNIEAIMKNIFAEYKMNIEDMEARDAFCHIVNELISNSVIVDNTNNKNFQRKITGKKGKLYPRMLILELTDKCNFYCPHCYKEATAKKSVFADFAKIKYFLLKLSTQLEYIEITGGEATLHPQINEIVKMVSEHTNNISLLTNGSNINLISNETFNLVDDIQVTLYGYDDNSYSKFTGNTSSFENVVKGLEILKSQKIKLVIAIGINRDNFKYLDNYIKFACKYVPYEIRFSLSVPLGRANKIDFDKKWAFSDDELEYIADKINNWADKLEATTKVRRPRYLFWEQADDKYQLNCTAGKYTITLSENGTVRPCNMLPEDIFSMGSVEKIADDMINGNIFDFSANIKKFENRLCNCGFELKDMKCAGFCKPIK